MENQQHLQAIIDEINKTRSVHIVTIEDPVEFIFKPIKSIVSQREMRSDTHSWQVALRSVLREDPDVVLVGEMRDFETISAAMTIAETGHLVFGTLHTNSALHKQLTELLTFFLKINKIKSGFNFHQFWRQFFHKD